MEKASAFDEVLAEAVLLLDLQLLVKFLNLHLLEVEQGAELPYYVDVHVYVAKHFYHGVGWVDLVLADFGENRAL